jgi:hypothetical protein
LKDHSGGKVSSRRELEGMDCNFPWHMLDREEDAKGDEQR